jgi:hypothetical protein
MPLINMSQFPTSQIARCLSYAADVWKSSLMAFMRASDITSMSMPNFGPCRQNRSTIRNSPSFDHFSLLSPGSRIWGGAGCVAVSDHLNRVSRISRSEFNIGAKGVGSYKTSQVSLRPTSEDTSLREPTPLLVKLPHAEWRYECLCNLTSGGKNVD